MSLPAGRFDRRATIYRRALAANVAGVARKDFEAVDGLAGIACAFREMTLREIAAGNGVQGGIEGEMRLRDSAKARTVTIADRAVIDGQGFDIVGAGLPANGEIIFMVRRQRG